MKIAFGLIAAALAVLGRNPPDAPAPQANPSPCGNAASLVDNPYATPEAREMAMEFLRVRYLGMAANGSPVNK